MSIPERCCHACKRKYGDPLPISDEEHHLNKRIEAIEEHIAAYYRQLTAAKAERVKLRDARYVGTSWLQCTKCNEWTDRPPKNGSHWVYCSATCEPYDD